VCVGDVRPQRTPISPIFNLKHDRINAGKWKDRPFIVLEFIKNYSFPKSNFIEYIDENLWKVSVGVKRILIIIQNQLLATSIQNLLAPNDGFLIQCAYEDNVPDMLAALNQHRPDILILDNSHTGREISKIFLMENNCPDVRVIVANVDNNHLKIYERFEIQLSRSADLVDAIRWDLASLLRGS
jgi:hypothetical protein